MATDAYNATNYGNRTETTEETEAWPSLDRQGSKGSDHISRPAGTSSCIGEHGGFYPPPAVH